MQLLDDTLIGANMRRQEEPLSTIHSSNNEVCIFPPTLLSHLKCHYSTTTQCLTSWPLILSRMRSIMIHSEKSQSTPSRAYQKHNLKSTSWALLVSEHGRIALRRTQPTYADCRLSGTAGTGKTTVAHTIAAEKDRRGRLAASFFFLEKNGRS